MIISPVLGFVWLLNILFQPAVLERSSQFSHFRCLWMYAWARSRWQTHYPWPPPHQTVSGSNVWSLGLPALAVCEFRGGDSAEALRIGTTPSNPSPVTRLPCCTWPGLRWPTGQCCSLSWILFYNKGWSQSQYFLFSPAKNEQIFSIPISYVSCFHWIICHVITNSYYKYILVPVCVRHCIEKTVNTNSTTLCFMKPNFLWGICFYKQWIKYCII